jgi:hypothetical protein
MVTSALKAIESIKSQKADPEKSQKPDLLASSVKTEPSQPLANPTHLSRLRKDPLAADDSNSESLDQVLQLYENDKNSSFSGPSEGAVATSLKDTKRSSSSDMITSFRNSLQILTTNNPKSSRLTLNSSQSKTPKIPTKRTLFPQKEISSSPSSSCDPPQLKKRSLSDVTNSVRNALFHRQSSIPSFKQKLNIPLSKETKDFIAEDLGPSPHHTKSVAATTGERTDSYLFHTACQVKTLLQPKFLAKEITAEQFKTIAKKVTTKFLQMQTPEDLKKPLIISPERLSAIKRLLDEEIESG